MVGGDIGHEFDHDQHASARLRTCAGTRSGSCFDACSAAGADAIARQSHGAADYLDCYFARIWGQQSSLGRMLDPIADKLLVASCLLILGAEKTIHGWSLLAAIVILCREILVSGLREYLAELRVSVPVTRLAKWKTTLQLVAVGFLICGEAGDAIVPVVTEIGIILLWLSALLTLYTGWDYLQAGLHHLTREDA